MDFMRSLLSKDSLLNKTNHIYKEISFLSSTHVDDNVSSRLISVVARLSCSSNMLEGDTGYDVIRHFRFRLRIFYQAAFIVTD